MAFMVQGASVEGMEESGGKHRAPAIATAIEVSVIFAGILAYIWRWQYSHPLFWMVLWAAIILSHVLHRDTLRGLGLTMAGFRPTAKWVLPLAVILYLPLVGYGFSDHSIALFWPTPRAPLMLLGYCAWCAFQQYLTQSYFNNRLMVIIRNRHVSSALVGIMFGATHIPNPILMVATLIAGVVFAEVFARYHNIWPLALAQGVGGLLIAAVSPAALIHHMRVGPAYFFYGIR